MEPNTEAQAPHNTSTTTSITATTAATAAATSATAITPGAEARPASNAQNLAALDPQTQHEQLGQLLANPEWAPETTAAAAPGNMSAGEMPRKMHPDDGTTPTAMATPTATAMAMATAAAASTDGQPAPEATGAAETETETEAETATGAEPESSRDKGKRFRFTDPADRQFAALRKEGIAPGEAARIAYGIGSGGGDPSSGNSHHQPESQPEPQPEAAASALAALQGQLLEIDRRLQATGASEGLMNAEIMALLQQRGDLAAEIRSEAKWMEREALAQAQHAAAVEAQARTAQRDAALAATERFPLLGQDGSAVRLEADRLLQLYRGSAFLEDPQAPIALAEQAAATVAQAQARAHGTSFESELARLDTAIPAAKRPGTAPASPHPPAPVPAAGRIIPAAGAQATRRPDQRATEMDQVREAQAALDPRAQHEALNRLLYGGA